MIDLDRLEEELIAAWTAKYGAPCRKGLAESRKAVERGAAYDSYGVGWYQVACAVEMLMDAYCLNIMHYSVGSGPAAEALIAMWEGLDQEVADG